MKLNYFFLIIFFSYFSIYFLDTLVFSLTKDFFFIILSVSIVFFLKKRSVVNQKLKVLYLKLKNQEITWEKYSNQLAYASLTKSIAHEIKNPLKMILIGSELILKNMTQKNLVKELTQKNIEIMLRLNKILENMLAYASNNSKIKNIFLFLIL